jgi:hypothetical protein
MAEPIVRSFVIDTTESEQNLKELNVQINATSTAINSGAQSFENVAAAEEEVVTSTKSLKAQLRELQAQLANTEPDSAKYRELAAAAGELKDRIGDAAEAVGTQAGSALERVSGSLGLVTSRIANLDFGGAAEGAKLLAANITQVKFSDISAGITSLGTSLGAVGKALLTNPIFLLGGALAALVVYADDVNAAIASLNPELERQKNLTAELNNEINNQAKSVGTQIAQVNALFNAVTDSNKADAERQQALNALQQLYPDIFANQNIDINNTEALTLAKLNLIQAIEAEAKANAARNLLEQKFAKQFELQQQLANQQEELLKKQEQLSNFDPFSAENILSGGTAAAAVLGQTQGAAIKIQEIQDEIALNAKSIGDLEKVVGDTIADNAIKNANKKAEASKKEVDTVKKTSDDKAKAAKDAADAQLKAEQEVSDLLNQLYEENVKEFEDAEKAKTAAAEAEAEKRKKAEEEYDAAITALRAEQDAKNLTADQQEILAIDQKYLDLREKAIQAGQSTVEVDAAYQQALDDQEKASAERRIQNEKAVQDAKLALTSEALGSVNALVGAFAKKDEASQRRAFKIQKAISIAQATVDTYKGANAIFASAAANPATVLFPAQPFIAAAGAIAAGIANVATIAKQEFQGGTPPATSENPPPSLDGGGGGAQPAQFNPLASAFLQDRPEQVTPRAYVLAGDVASQQEVRTKVEDLSRIG